MKIKVQSIHFTADKKLVDFIEEKVEHLRHFYENIIEGEVFLRIDKNNHHENKVAEIRLNTPGKILFAKEQCNTFEKAAGKTVDSLKRQITRHKEKRIGL